MPQYASTKARSRTTPARILHHLLEDSTSRNSLQRDKERKRERGVWKVKWRGGGEAVTGWARGDPIQSTLNATLNCLLLDAH